MKTDSLISKMQAHVFKYHVRQEVGRKLKKSLTLKQNRKLLNVNGLLRIIKDKFEYNKFNVKFNL